MWWSSLGKIFSIGVFLIAAAATESCHPKACKKNTDNEKAICGSDGLSYPNRCHFEKARCQNRTLTLIRRGPCKHQRPCHDWPNLNSNPNSFKPNCRPDGTYDSTQCHPSTGFCWCVTPEGVPLPYTTIRRKPGAKARCGRKKSTRRRSPSRKNRNRTCKQPDKALFNNNLINIFHSELDRERGVSTPHNNQTDSMVVKWKFLMLDQDENGILDKSEYKDLRKVVKKAVKPKRCAKNFARACDVNGDQLISLQEWADCLTRDGMDDGRGQNSSTDNTEESEDYEDNPFVKSPPPHGVLSAGSTSMGQSYDEDSPETHEDEPTDCISDRKTALADLSSNQLYVPECTSDGRYKKIQCYKSAGYCWCVNEDSGKNIPGTSVKNETPKCDQLKTSNKTMKGCPDEKKIVFLRQLLQFLHMKMSEVISNANGTRTGTWADSKEEQVATWSFVVFDKNLDKMLNRNEWKAFKEMVSSIKGLRKCGKKLPRYCDNNRDRQISMTEWLECLNVQQAVVNSSTNSSPRAGKTNPLSILMED